ncbi:YceD family protein [Magnetofaba australis]|uniref:DUF177 domain-containing protein n=1 Tax=Magnetofaba australis IT-1 TaxID=1434232 RepID=A0A1Y2K571_9PROT|nr:DUF177 domain-containing protein [Magnetofaba australis]OSM04399.1 hypothetical protein MAIT1_04307 [Magnetofaba australis IT-1]
MSRELSDKRLPLSALGHKPQHLVGHIDAASLEQAVAMMAHAPQPAQVDVTAQRDQGKLSVQGRVSIVAPLVCSRCLCEFDQSLEVSVSRQFVSGDDPVAESAGEVRMEDETTYLKDDVFVLRRMVDEELVLAIPPAPLCREACAGICPGCGVNLNDEACVCRDEVEDGPFAALKNLRLTGQ